MSTSIVPAPTRRASDDPEVLAAAEKIRVALGKAVRIENVLEMRYLTSGVRSILDHLNAKRQILFSELARELLVDQAFRTRRKAQIKISLSEVLDDVALLTLVVRERSWHGHKVWSQAEKDTLRTALVQPAVVAQLRELAEHDTEEKVTRGLKELPDEVARPLLQAVFPAIVERTVRLVDNWVEPDPMHAPRIETPNTPYAVKFKHRRRAAGDDSVLSIHLVSFETTEIFASQEDVSGIPVTLDLPNYGHELLSAAEFFFKTWAENKAPIDAVRNSDIFENTGRFVEMPHIQRRVEIWRVREPYWVFAGIVDRNSVITDQMLLSEAMGRLVNLQGTTFDGTSAGEQPFPALDFETAPHESIVLVALPADSL